LVLKVGGLDARLSIFLCEHKKAVAKSREVETASNLAKFSKIGCCSKSVALPMTMILSCKHTNLCICVVNNDSQDIALSRVRLTLTKAIAAQQNAADYISRDMHAS
jgi:hypothetical protein